MATTATTSSPSSPSATATREMESHSKSRQLFEQNDSGLSSMGSLDLWRRELESIEEQPADHAAPQHHHQQTRISPALDTTQTSQLKTLTSGLSNLNLRPLGTHSDAGRDCGSRNSCCAETRARLEMLEMHGRKSEQDSLRSFLCDNDSGHFSLTTVATECCEDPVSQHQYEDVALHRGVKDAEVETEAEKTTDNFYCVSGSSLRRNPRDIAREAINSVYVSAEQRIALYQGDVDGDNCLNLSIINGHLKLALFLINVAPDYIWLSYSNLLRQTPLHLAVLTGQYHLARRLLCAGAIVDAQDLRGDTPLHIACRMGMDNMIKALLAPVRFEETRLNQWEIPYQRLPQDLGVRNFEGLTPLHVAVLSGHQRVVQLLLDAGADPNIGDAKSGRTALHLAAERGRTGLVELLARRPDVDLLKRNYAGLTAAQLALGRNLERIAHLVQTDEDVSDAESEMTVVASASEDDWSDSGME